MLRRLVDYLPFVPSHPKGFKPVMDLNEARKILSIEGRRESVAERYIQMMKINHPDRGGSPYIASKINEARNLLGGKEPAFP
ncbi:uncharacterized protein Eint_070805 [Encephalitozoon intestinalis ATCC 50506]|uniref:Mitochondrial import inner membrane translocase subunit TIM14 n=1 Tax=Encephalitozoon intestinalis (strain ATCC 50506) TaxID=876142 RepID=W8PGS1_ENCIT|nr:uncharacterized protein Eint_070805 [Encephalitozoon intestinalis ATCC 50506]AHL30126.1 hypothetical protein Eint_070805 [Encephalitozoon intestinalis ATCC 50506]UTX45596.1 hypothetical protein GPK93_07g11600 [Encephalitozoon intestinalis]